MRSKRCVPIARYASDAVSAVTTSNASANKIDFYLQRDIDYQVHLSPNDSATNATATADVTLKLDNTAPATGLPQVVIGPFLPGRFQAGENRTYVSVYSPLALRKATIDGKPIAMAPGTERKRNVYSVFTSVFARSTQTLGAQLAGSVELRDGWYQLDIGHQPTLRADHVSVSIDVPKGWRIAAAPGMEISLGRHASARLTLEKAKSLRVHIVRDPGTWNLWDRLEAGT